MLLQLSAVRLLEVLNALNEEPLTVEPFPETFERPDILDNEPLSEVCCLEGAATNLLDKPAPEDVGPDTPEPDDTDGLSPVV